MTKRALLVGCTGGGLPECANDPRLAARYLSTAPYNFDCHIVSDETITLEKWIAETLWLYGADVAVLLYSGHGYRAKVGGKVQTGIWSGVPISHALFEQSVLAPLRKNTGTLIRIYDCCFSGGGVRTARAVGKDKYATTIKCRPLCAEDEPVSSPHYHSVTEKDVVIAACSARQVSYGMFDGNGAEFWHPLSTRTEKEGLCSYFSYTLWPSLNYWQFWYTSITKGVNKICQPRSNAGLDYFAAGNGWRMAPGVKYPLPNVILNKPAKVPDNILIAT